MYYLKLLQICHDIITDYKELLEYVDALNIVLGSSYQTCYSYASQSSCAPQEEGPTRKRLFVTPKLLASNSERSDRNPTKPSDQSRGSGTPQAISRTLENLLLAARLLHVVHVVRLLRLVRLVPLLRLLRLPESSSDRSPSVRKLEKSEYSSETENTTSKESIANIVPVEAMLWLPFYER